MERKSGILMHISSLPSNQGIGNFGKEAYKFVDFLVESGQSYWQILPLTTTSYGDSPYQSFSAYAGNPHFIDLDSLVEEGLIKKEDYKKLDFGQDKSRVDYEKVYTNRRPVLEKAVKKFLSKKENIKKLEDFEKDNSWLNNYAEFIAIKESFDNKSLEEWPDKKIIDRDKASLEKKVKKLKKEILFHKTVQYFFFSQWAKLKNYANEKGIKIFGDMPIYVSRDSVEMWTQKELFKTNKKGELSFVAGVPADDFSEDGQFWGNPIYDWKAQEKEGFTWWIERVKNSFKLYDTLRIDHFRGFSEYWQIKASSDTALKGAWRKGPGIKLFKAIEKELGKLDIIAEDLGIIDESTEELLKKSGFPGMKVLQFAFDGDINNTYLLDNHIENSVAYIGTHDNDTTISWYEELDEVRREEVADYLDKEENESISWAMIRVLQESDSRLTIIPMQDLLEKDGQARMNKPATTENNWQWRMLENELTQDRIDFLKKVTIENNR